MGLRRNPPEVEATSGQQLCTEFTLYYKLLFNCFKHLLRVSFEILKSVNTSIRGSREPFFRSEVVDDFKVNCTAADLFFMK